MKEGAYGRPEVTEVLRATKPTGGQLVAPGEVGFAPGGKGPRLVPRARVRTGAGAVRRLARTGAKRFGEVAKWLRQRFAKPSGSQGPRGFESHPLR